MIDITTIRRGLREKRRAARKNIRWRWPVPRFLRAFAALPGHRWPFEHRASPVDTTCRICGRTILKGTDAYVARGEMHCIHHNDLDLEWPFKVITSAIWGGNCIRCKNPINPGDTFVWRSRSWCAHHGPKAGVEHVFHCHKADME